MYVKVVVVAGAKKESFEAVSENRFKISVRQPAQRSLANGRVRELIALHFNVPLERVRIINGHQSPSKLLSVDVET